MSKSDPDPSDPRRTPRPSKRVTSKHKSGNRTFKYYEPHSPFQLLIEERRLAHHLSTHDMGKLLGVSQSTFWIWLHSQQGYPSPRSFDPDKHLPLLSRALSISTDQLRESLDASRLAYTGTGVTLHTAQDNRARIELERSELEALLSIFENDKRTTLKREYVVNAIKRAITLAKLGPGRP